MKPSPNDFLTIKTLSQLSGLSTHTIRAWERRYSALNPTRSSGNHRTYSFEHLERLNHLKKVVGLGFSIGNVAHLPSSELFTILLKHSQGQTQKNDPRETLPQDKKTSDYLLQEVTSALKTFNLGLINEKLSFSKTTLGAKSFVLDFASPLLAEIGVQIEKGNLGVAHEHALSALLRNHLAQILQSLPSPQNVMTSGPHTIAFCTLEGDYHEFGILLSQILTTVYGLPNFYLGPNLPIDALLMATEVVRPKILVIGCTYRNALQENALPLQNLLEELIQKSPPHLELWVGGASTLFIKKSKWLQKRVHWITDLKNFEEKIAAISPTQKEAP